jgi:hypothetical protein
VEDEQTVSLDTGMRRYTILRVGIVDAGAIEVSKKLRLTLFNEENQLRKSMNVTHKGTWSIP